MPADSPALDRPASVRDLFRQRNFSLFLSGDFVSLIGNWTQRIAIGWLTWQLTESPAWLGIISFADLFPSVVLSPLGGVIADRGDPRRICFQTQVIAMLHASTLFACSAAGLLNIWLLVVFVILRGSIAALNQPARFALIPSLITRDLLPVAMATTSVSFNLARFIGPAAAGLVIVRFGVSGAFAVNAASYVSLLIALWMLDVTPVKREARAKQSVVAQIVAGYRYVSHHAGVGPVLLLFAVGAVLVRPLSEMMPGYADGIFGQGASGLAWLTSAMGIGAMLGGLLMVRRNRFEQVFQAINYSQGAMAAAVALFAVAPVFWLAVALALVAGFAISVNGIGTQILAQSAVADDMRGRVMSLYGVLFRAGPALGALIIGAIGDHVGLAWPTAVGAIGCGLVWLWSLRRRAAMKAALTPAAK